MRKLRRAPSEATASKRVRHFDETWQRDDAEDIKFNADYAIGENVELVGVRLRSLECTCAATTEAEAPAVDAPASDNEPAQPPKL
ncbi:MAG TPA: hypothetical protein VM692_08440 [Gammaproteobacteria bacterium]|nr:hypothetical protein [Gammaproteobacteria bacterium]